ncbi:MAG: arsenic efflux protein [Lachnospiraceae bacterium]|jgi:hypothetical protein|nr:arsenic efflux protein [Lachnospiraceae bacterium]
MTHILEHTLLDTIELIPFLLIAYLAMEYMEHKMGNKATAVIGKAGKLGPIAGGLAGAIPQCGFSAAASNLYVGHIITRGTLIAIYLSTSDEMLPIMISKQVEGRIIALILLLKIAIGIMAGFVIDKLCPRREEHETDHIHDICVNEHCHCERGIWGSAFRHTIKITGYILLFTFALNGILHYGGEEMLQNLAMKSPIIGPLVAALVGLIPNCAASVAITSLYLNGAMSFGAMMSGLLVGAGIGLLVLLRVNHNKKDNLQIIAYLFGIGVLCGILIDLCYYSQPLSRAVEIMQNA